MQRLPISIFIVVFALSIALTQFLAFQQYKLSNEATREELSHEATEVKDRFRNILFNDIAAANTLAIIYKQYGVPAKFDSVAQQIIQNSRYAEALQVTENGIVKNVYPDIRYKATIGTNVNANAVRKAEEARAIELRGIYFAGPRRLRFGDTGILGKVPIITNNKVMAITTVLTKLPTIKKALAPPGINKKRFAYQLLDTHVKNSPFYLLSDSKPAANSEHVDLHIPEGDWLLRVSYCNEYTAGSFPLGLSGLGALLSLVVALLAYRKVREPYKLKKIIDEKTGQLAKSEKYFRTLIETSSDAIVLMDATGKVLYQTPSTEKILGYTLDEIQQIEGIELIHPDDRAGDNQLFTEIVNNPNSIIIRKHRVKHKNGNYLQIEGTYRNLLGDESVGAIVYSYTDITEKILAGERLEQYNRELSLLNQINDIILRDEDEFLLYKDVCECIVSSGRYRLAWICQKPGETDADQAVLPLAIVGNAGYVTDIRIDLNDPELSNGTTGIALKTGRKAVNNDMTNTSFFRLWVDSAKEFGIRSSIALPLSMGHGRFGALTIYASQTDAFDAYEVSILDRLVANLSIAVQGIRNRNILAESEDRFRRAFADSAIGMGLTSIEEPTMGRWLKVNQSLCDMLGYSEEELLSRTFMQITHPDDLEGDLAAQSRILKGGSDTYRIEKRYIHKNGSFVWINLNVSMIRDRDKKPIYLVAQVENITEKVESQIKFQNLVENFVVGVYILQHDKLVYVNPRILEETGYKEEEVIDIPFERFIHPEDLEFVSGMVDARINEDIKNIRYEARIQPKHGEPIWYEIFGGLIMYKGAPALMGTMINITERKAIYDELLKSEANLRSMFDTTSVSFLLMDASYKIIALNQQMKDGYVAAAGLDLAEGDDLIEAMLPEKRAAAKVVYDRVMQTNSAENYETSYEKDGIHTHFFANVKPIRDGIKVIGVCISALDITERKKMTLDLLSHVNAIEEQNKKLREIAWIQSHVVRAPLSRIMGLIDLLNNHENSDIEEQRTILNYILVSAEELDEIIKGITDKVYVNDDGSIQPL